MRSRRRITWSALLVCAVLGSVTVVATNAATVTVARTSAPCAVGTSASGTGYWTPFGTATWTALGLQTTSRSDSSQAYGVTCGGATVYGNVLPTTDPHKITALSFDFVADSTGPSGQSPRLVVCFSDGTNCASNGNLAPTSWTAGVSAHVDALAPAAGNDVWTNSGGRCGGSIPNSFSAVIACHPGASVTAVAVVNDGGGQYPAGEQVLLNNMRFNNVFAHGTPPILGKRAEIAPLSGTVSVRQPGSTHFIRVRSVQPLRYGSVVHSGGGHVQVIAATPGHRFQSGQFYSGGFNLTQTSSGYVQATLTGQPKGCPTPRLPAGVTATKPIKLWGHVKGHYRTRGNYGSASVQGTQWLTENRCDGTFFHVVEGTLRIRDFVRHKTIILHAGHSYLARKPVVKDPDHDGDNDLSSVHGG